MMTTTTTTSTTETYHHSTYTNEFVGDAHSTTTTTKDTDPSLLVANMTIDELVESCCNEVLPSSSSQLNSSSVSPSHLVRFVHSQSSLVSQIDETNPLQQSPSNATPQSSHETPMKQTSLINVTRLPSPFSTLKSKTRVESTHSMQNTTNLTNITANNISVNNYNVNIHTTNVQPPPPAAVVPVTPTTNDHLAKTCPLDQKQTTEIVSQILKNIKEVENTHEQPTTTTTNYNIHIDSFNFSSSNEQASSLNKKPPRAKKEAKALTKIIVKDEPTTQVSPNFSRTKKSTKHLSAHQSGAVNGTPASTEFVPVPYGWQRRILSTDLVVYLR